MESTPHPNSEIIPKNKYSFYWTVVITIFVTVIVTLLACYVLMVSIQVGPKPLVIQPQDSNEVVKLKQDLFEARVAYWEKENDLYVTGLTYDPNNRHKFYYAAWDMVPGTNQILFAYDLVDDTDYDKFGEIDPNLGSKALYTVHVGDAHIRIADIFDDKLIFYTTGEGGSDDSPGPCFEPLLSDFYKLQVLDLKTKKVEPFTPSKELLDQKSKAENECMSQLE